MRKFKSNLQQKYHNFLQAKLDRAIEKEHLLASKLWLRLGANPNHIDQAGQTPLYKAIQVDHKSNKARFVPLLLRKGANPRMIDKEAQPSLSETEPLLSLLKNQTIPLYNHSIPSHSPSRESSPLLEEKSKPNQSKDTKENEAETSLIKAVAENDIEMARLLLEKGISPNLKDSQGELLLSNAFINRNHEMAMLLLEKGANPNRNHYTRVMAPLCWAMFSGNKIAMLTMLEKGADVNPPPYIAEETPLHIAIVRESVDEVLLLLQKGARPNVVNKEGKTPLYYAMSRGTIDIFNLLLQNGASIEHTLTYCALYKVPLLMDGLLPDQQQCVKAMIKHYLEETTLENASLSLLQKVLGSAEDLLLAKEKFLLLKKVQGYFKNIVSNERSWLPSNATSATTESSILFAPSSLLGLTTRSYIERLNVKEESVQSQMIKEMRVMTPELRSHIDWSYQVLSQASIKHFIARAGSL